MAFSSVVTGQKDLGGAKLIYGTWDADSVATGTINFRGQNPTGTNAPVPYAILAAGVTNTASSDSTVATAWSVSDLGTILIGVCAASDTGTWYAILA